MGEEALVESDILDSIALVKRLDAQGDNPSIVVWHYFPDASEWRLFLAGPTFDVLMPREELRAYQKIADALNEEEIASLSIGKIKIVRTDFPLVQATKPLVNTGSQRMVRGHFKDIYINGIFIKEMLILRSSGPEEAPVVTGHPQSVPG